MSTYLVALVVSKFTCSDGLPLETNVTNSVCSTPKTSTQREFALNMTPTLMNTLENYTHLQYNGSGLTKLHQIAIPDFSAGAMENWGLVTYR